jgi:hypothetical protein
VRQRWSLHLHPEVQFVGEFPQLDSGQQGDPLWPTSTTIDLS